MKIGLDLDGTVYSFPAFFAAFICAMNPQGHKFYCTSSHGRDEWPQDLERLFKLGIQGDLIDPSLMHHERHGDLAIKGKAADYCDVVFDDDVRLASYTRTPVFSPHAS